MIETTKFALAIGDNARMADMPLVTYGCVEGATIGDIIKFQLPYLNRFKGAEIEVHLSAGHCDIVRATLRNHRKQGRPIAEPEINFDSEINAIIRSYTTLVTELRGKNATLILYPLRNPLSYTPICADLRPLAPFYELGVRQLNGYIKGWGSKLNFATIANVNS